VKCNTLKKQKNGKKEDKGVAIMALPFAYTQLIRHNTDQSHKGIEKRNKGRKRESN